MLFPCLNSPVNKQESLQITVLLLHVYYMYINTLLLKFFLPESWVRRVGWKVGERPDQQLPALDLKPATHKSQQR